MIAKECSKLFVIFLDFRVEDSNRASMSRSDERAVTPQVTEAPRTSLAQKLFAPKILFLTDLVNGHLVVRGSTSWVRRTQNVDHNECLKSVVGQFLQLTQ